MLKIEQAFKIIEQIEYKSVLRNHRNKKFISIPKLQISEDWGKPDTLDRGVLNFIVDKAFQGSSAKSLRKISELNDFLKSIENGVYYDTPSRTVANIMLFETMMRIYNSFSTRS